MKLKEYIKLLQEYEDQYGDLDLIYSTDDEGNSYQKVGFPPSLCMVYNLNQRYLEDVEFVVDDPDEFNAICIN